MVKYSLKKKKLGNSTFVSKILTFQEMIKNKKSIKNSARIKNNIKISKEAHIPQITTVRIKKKKK